MNTNIEHQKIVNLNSVLVAVTLFVGCVLMALPTWGGGQHVHGTIGHGAVGEPTPTPSPSLGEKLSLPYTTDGQSKTIDETGVTYNFSTYIVSDGDENKLYEYEKVNNEMQLLRTIDVNGLPDVEDGDRIEDVAWMWGKYALLISDTIHVVTLPPMGSDDTIELEASDEEYQIEVDTTVTETATAIISGTQTTITRTRDVRLASIAYSLFHSGGNAEFFYVGSSGAEPSQKIYDYTPEAGEKVYIFEVRKLQNPDTVMQFDPLVFEPSEAMWTADAIYNPPHSPTLYILSEHCKHIIEVEPHGAGFNTGYDITHEMDMGDMEGKPTGLYMPYDTALDNSTEMIVIDDMGEIAIFDGLLDLQDTDWHWNHSSGSSGTSSVEAGSSPEY